MSTAQRAAKIRGMQLAIVVDNVDGNGNPWYRIRSLGTAPVMGLKRTTMDDRMGVLV